MSSDVPGGSVEGDVEVDGANRAVAELRAAGRARAIAEARLASAAVAVADLCEDREHDGLEVAAIMCWTPQFADNELAWCRELIDDLPQVFAAWRVGEIDRHRARIFVDCLSTLLVEHPAQAQAIAAGCCRKRGRGPGRGCAPRFCGSSLRPIRRHVRSRWRPRSPTATCG